MPAWEDALALVLDTLKDGAAQVPGRA